MPTCQRYAKTLWGLTNPIPLAKDVAPTLVQSVFARLEAMPHLLQLILELPPANIFGDAGVIDLPLFEYTAVDACPGS